MKPKSFTIKLMSMAIAAATAISSAASLSLTNTASAADTDTTIETKSTLPTSLQNGDFESPDIQGILKSINWDRWDTNHGMYTYNNQSYHVSNDINYEYNEYNYGWNTIKPYPNIITYRNNDAWFVTSKDIFDKISDNKFYWETTDYNQRVELALDTNGMDKYFGDGKATASSGSQFAELVPESPSSLYQTISTPDEKVLSWSLDHRARKNNETQSDDDTNTDIMAVFIGPKQDYLKKASDSANDIFMEMAALLKTKYDNMEIGSQIGPYTIYSKKIKDDTIINNTCVSTTEHDDYTEEWQCWIVKSGSDKWYTHSGTYTVPEGQKETTLAFTAMTTSLESKIEGNCLDNIRLGELFPLTLTAMPGGTGSMEPTDQSSATVTVDGDGTDGTPTSKKQLYEVNKEVTITATPKDGYIFTGAIVNGQNIGISSNGGFVKNDDGTYTTYTYEVTIDQTYNVVLTFAQKGYITYDANGGTLSNNGQTTYSHEFKKIGEKLEKIPSAVNGKKTFLGWRLLAANKNGVQEVVTDDLIPENHNVAYSTNSGKAELTISWSDENGEYKSKTLSASQEDAVLLLAVYQQNLSVIPKTLYFGETSYISGDTTGGKVTVKNITTSSDDSASCTITAGNEYKITTSPKSGFKLDRLYYTLDGHDYLLYTYNGSYSSTFSSNRDVTVYAEFSEIPIHAHYAFVPEDEDTQNGQSAFVKESVTNKEVGNYSGSYGGDEYGNTISTGFFTKRQFSTPEKPSGIWTIQIPENGTYFKIPDAGTSTNTIGTLKLDKSNSGLSDSINVQNNKGTIYGVENQNGTTNLTLQVFVGTETTISGNGSVQFGLIIDNLYAPEARAGFRETSTKPNNIIELNESNSIYTNDKSYDHNEDTLNGNKSSEATEPTETAE